jgi:hypothetical protein
MSPVAGIPEAMQGSVVTRAWLLYSMHKKTLRECAAILYPETQYASEWSLTMAIYRQFRRMDLPLREPGPIKGKPQRPKRKRVAS